MRSKSVKLADTYLSTRDEKDREALRAEVRHEVQSAGTAGVPFLTNETQFEKLVATRIMQAQMFRGDDA